MTKKITKWNIISAVSIVMVLIVSISLLCTAGKLYPWVSKDNPTAIVEQEIVTIGNNSWTQKNVDYLPLDKAEINSFVLCTGFMGCVGIFSIAAQLGFYGVKIVKKLTKKDNIRIGKSA